MDPVLQSTVEAKIEAALAAKLTDQRIVEIDVQEKVIKRLTDLGKIVGIPIGLLVVLLGALGIKTLSDLDSKVKDATNQAVTKMNAKVDLETQQAIATLHQKVDTADNQLVEQAGKTLNAAVNSATRDIQSKARVSEKSIDDLRDQFEKRSASLATALAAQNAKLGTIQNTVDKLSAQQIGSRFEGTRLKPFQDAGGMWTVGSSHPLTPEEVSSGKVLIDGKPVDFRNGITPEQAKALLQQDLNAAGLKIDQLVTVKLTDNQKQALEDFVLNLGIRAFQSSVLPRLNAGDYNSVPEAMLKWSSIGGQEMPALKSRREEEIKLWNTR